MCKKFNGVGKCDVFPAEAKGGLGSQAQAAAQAGGGLVPEPQG